MRSPCILVLVVLAACGSEPAYQSSCINDGDCNNPQSCAVVQGWCSKHNEPPPSYESPCGQVTSAGRCVSQTVVERCVVPSGASSPRVSRVSCGAGEACSVASDGAQCRQVAECRDGESRCSAMAYQVCSAGHWTTQTCNGTCQTTSYGATCQSVQIKTINLKFSYEAKVPNEDFSDWVQAASRFTAGGLHVTSIADGRTIDSVLTGNDGKFALKVPVSPKADDRVVVSTVGWDGGTIRFMVARPGFTNTELEPGESSSSARAWSWQIATRDLSEGTEFWATIPNGSAAIWVFSTVRWAYLQRKQDFNRAPKSLLVWVDPSVTFTCGACQWDDRVVVANVPFDSQIALNGGNNEGYWSDPVTAHELGHWIMSSYSTRVGEGGSHFLGNPTFPGQAWSEGWATYHQAALLGLAYYLDKQDGAMFWVDLAEREYSDGSAWYRPAASNGLLQYIDENEVAAMLLQLHDSSPNAGNQILAALASRRMTGSTFGRGYTRHSWSVSSSGAFSNIVDSHEPTPHFADFLDALNCSGFSRSAIDQATRPTVNYPYPSQSPICQ